MLFDVRRMSGEPTVADVKAISDVTAPIQVFRDPTDADHWLASQMR